MSVTIKDVAVKCGLSISTVSKAFNNYGDISQETRETVLAAARDLGYHPNAIARTLKTNRSYSIGVVFSDNENRGLTHSFFASVLEAFKKECEHSSYDITFINHNISWAGMTYLEHCRYRNVDGVCVVCADYYSPEMQQLVLGDIPCVTIDHTFNNRSSVISENITGMQELVRYAAALGHERIAYIHGQLASSVSQMRRTGYYCGMQVAGLQVPPEYVVESHYDNPDLCYQAVKSLLSLPTPPTCILVPDDHAAFGALRAAKELHLQVPEDLSIAGYDGSRLSQMVTPPLTTVRQDMEAIGREAARVLIDTIENPRTTPAHTVSVPCSLVPGGTIGKPKM